jgi:hypothetical protein
VKTTRWVVLLTFLAAVANGAEVYKSTDKNGVPTYSDRPSENSQPVFVATPRAGRSGNTAAARPDGAQPNPTAPQPGAQQAAAAPKPPAADAQTPEERAAERTTKCAAARERAEKYTAAHKLFREGTNGEREYLTDGEIDEARARAAADVSTWCS